MNSGDRAKSGIRRWDFANDLIPGLTTAAVVVPKALAYVARRTQPRGAGTCAEDASCGALGTRTDVLHR